MPFISCFFQKPLPWMSIVVLVVVSGVYLGYGVSSIILISILTVSTVIFNSYKLQPNPKTVEESVQERTINSSQNVTSQPVQDEEEEEECVNGGSIKEEESPVDLSLSESECHGRSSTSEDSEADYWKYDQGSVFRDNSDEDGSISDEDSLIEIALPSGVYIDDHYKQEEKKKLGDDLEFFKQQINLVELLAELKEENLIEIDLSIGSIKCTPRFEIQA